MMQTKLLPKTAVIALLEDVNVHAVDLDCCCASGWVLSEWTDGSTAVKQRPQAYTAL
jgi:hypothetical protein